MKIYAIATLILLSGLQTTDRTQQSADFTVYGLLNSSCGTWTATKNRSELELDATLGGWVEGFVTGAGFVGFPMKATDRAGLITWMNDYCAAHPLVTIPEATGELVKTLYKAK